MTRVPGTGLALRTRRPFLPVLAAGLVLPCWPVAVVAAGVTTAAAPSTDAGTSTAPMWPDDYVGRVEALAVLQTLNAELLSHDSATATLERWCSIHHLASPAVVVAEQVRGAKKVPSPQQRAELAVTPTETVRYRRVRLRCGAHVLSEADNWYVPSRLTPSMNKQLQSTDVPFGKVVRELHFQRHTLESRLLWAPLPAGWEMTTPDVDTSSSPRRLPNHLLQHRALLVLPNGTPISEVVETYTSNVLGFAAPHR